MPCGQNGKVILVSVASQFVELRPLGDAVTQMEDNKTKGKQSDDNDEDKDEDEDG